MSADKLAPIIIKRKKIVGGDGHHGGAWKVAICAAPSVRRRFCAGYIRVPFWVALDVVLTAAVHDVSVGPRHTPRGMPGEPRGLVVTDVLIQMELGCRSHRHLPQVLLILLYACFFRVPDPSASDLRTPSAP